MPTYGYRCGQCGHEFEVIQKISDEPLTACPKCGGKLAKMLYPAGVIFKGSGYYTTDYKGSGSTPSSAGGSNGEAAKSESKSEGGGESNAAKSDTKSEGKSDTKSEGKSDSKTEKAS